MKHSRQRAYIGHWSAGSVTGSDRRGLSANRVKLTHYHVNRPVIKTGYPMILLKGENMKTEEFDTKLKELAMLTGSDQSDTLFNSEYELLLNEVKKDEPTPERQEMLQRMRTLLNHQAAFLMNLYLRARRIQGMM
jgi:hypothetical protein